MSVFAFAPSVVAAAGVERGAAADAAAALTCHADGEVIPAPPTPGEDPHS